METVADYFSGTGDTNTHMYAYAGLIRGHKCKQGTQVFQELKTALSSNVGDGVNRHHVLPLGLPVHLLPKLLRIFPRKPEATSSGCSNHYCNSCVYACVYVCVLVAQSCLALCNPTRGCIPGSPGESGLVSRGSQGLRSPLESRRGSLGAP